MCETSSNPRFVMSLRDFFLLEYADLLSEHPKHASTWRLAADYLYVAGTEGRKRLGEYILHVGLMPPPQEDGQGDQDMEVELVDPQVEYYTHLFEACQELGLLDQWKIISQVMADRMMRQANFGNAATMYAAADDVYGMARLSEKVFETYITEGKLSCSITDAAELMSRRGCLHGVCCKIAALSAQYGRGHTRREADCCIQNDASRLFPRICFVPKTRGTESRS